MSLYTLVVQNSDKTQEKEFQLDGVDILYKRGDVCDTFNVDSNGVATVTRRIGIDPATGESYILPNPITTTWGTLQIELYEGINYLKLLDDNNTVLSVAYILKNEFTDTYATRVEMNSSIEQSANNILLQVSQKYPEKDAIISSINLSPEEIAINSNKISLAGKTIQMTSDNIAINSTNFQVDKNGNMTCNNANIQGDIRLNSSNYLKAYDSNNKLRLSLNPHNLKFNDNNGNEITNIGLYGGNNSKATMFATNADHSPSLLFTTIRDDGQTFDKILDYRVNDNIWETYKPFNNIDIKTSNTSVVGLTVRTDASSANSTITPTGIWSGGSVWATTEMHATDFQRYSLKEKKKNIKNFNDKALKIIKGTDIYEYNYKNDVENCKKRIGIIIGDDYNYSKIITNNDNDAMDLGSMISVAYKGIQEQQEMIEKQQKEINKLKKEIKLLKEGK